jgi:hypothetical protein
MNREQLEALENEVNTELDASATSTAEPITDGVVDFDLYLASAPKILWILKEPVDEIINGVPAGGGWSMTKHVLSVGKFGNKPPFAPMAYVAYSVFNNFPKWAEIDYVTENPKVKEAVKHIAYINISKMPALSTSGGTDFAGIYRQNRHLLRKQIDGMQPDVIIGGSTLPFFFSDLHLDANRFMKKGSASFCLQDSRLYIDAYHPSQWNVVDNDDYVDDIVAIIKEHSPVLPPPKS